MNAKEKNIINTLKIVSAEQDKLSRAAQKDNQHMAALYALTIAIATSEAAKIIEEQSKEIDTLKTQSTVAAMNPSSIGRCILYSWFSNDAAIHHYCRTARQIPDNALPHKRVRASDKSPPDRTLSSCIH
ncbi:hypothetical protein EC12E070_00340 [Escherichia coli O145:H28]|nr:hypothetical protein EC12E070_00340 [Escherichia coli O145:H28]